MLTAAVSLGADEMRGIALGEMARKRRRLGELTPEQERALRSLMVSVADNIFTLVSGVAPAEGAGEERGAEVV